MNWNYMLNALDFTNIKIKVYIYGNIKNKSKESIHWQNLTVSKILLEIYVFRYV